MAFGRLSTIIGILIFMVLASACSSTPQAIPTATLLPPTAIPTAMPTAVPTTLPTALPTAVPATATSIPTVNVQTSGLSSQAGMKDYDVINAVWSPDSKVLALPGTFNHPQVTLFTADGQAITTLAEAASQPPLGLLWSPDGSWLLASPPGQNGQFTVWGARGEKMAALQPAAPGAFLGAAWLPDSQTVLLVSQNRPKTVWTANATTGQETSDPATGLLNVGDAAIHTLAVSPDGKYAAFGVTTKNRVLVWSLTEKTQIAQLEGHTGLVEQLAWSADSQVIASGGQDGTVRLWKATGQAISSAEGYSANNRFQWSPDGRYVAYIGPGDAYNKIVHLLGADGKTTKVTLSFYRAGLWWLDGSKLAFLSTGTGLPVINLDGSLAMTLLPDHTISKLTLSPDGQVAAFVESGQDDTLNFVRIENQE